MREIKQLKSEPQEGIRIVTDEENILDVTGIIQGPGMLSVSLAMCSHRGVAASDADANLKPISHSRNSLRRRLLPSSIQLH